MLRDSLWKTGFKQNWKTFDDHNRIRAYILEFCYLIHRFELHFSAKNILLFQMVWQKLDVVVNKINEISPDKIWTLWKALVLGIDKAQSAGKTEEQ